MLDRRQFFLSAAAATALSTLPLPLAADELKSGPLPSRSLYDRDENAYWKAIREQSVIPADEIYLNNGTCGSSPAPVLKAVFDSYFDAEKMDDSDPEQYPLFGYGKFNQYREPVAKFINCSLDEIAIVRNATEANCIMAYGLDLRPGDEILISDQENPSGQGPWNLRAMRLGIVIN